MPFTIETDGIWVNSATGPGNSPYAKLLGGYYALDTGTGTGTAQVVKQFADAGTGNVLAAAQAANTHAVLQLSPGMYSLQIATAGIDASLTKVKGGI